MTRTKGDALAVTGATLFMAGAATGALPVIGAVPWSGWILALSILGICVYQLAFRWFESGR